MIGNTEVGPHRSSSCPGRSVPRPATILVADDHQFVRHTLHSLLAEQPDWKIYEAENGKVALDRAREIQPDVVVLDIVMPEMSGTEAAYKIRQLVPAPKIVLISSHYTPEEAAILAHLFGDANFIPKSEAGKALVPAVSRLLAEESQAH
jgi:DNA-binding NarL/FixJ family response regulator